ncbi:MAG: chromosome segregation protein SMC [SAR86 cluster bacterium]|uniref:Chromosome partition protein Smc n=1 Tax=SAR86 cluster bacterium TaxID=2030880 RepID=A0A2A5BA80_9GAMM|nr:MAG: chromosome segregation protein SMC [SAR86 cluster bacterium]
MRLKCIKLAGFKSFVDPTTIEFPSNLCSVVGPNGCGKSNVIDAVRWVMGESSAKNLRGENMTDVIFNGSSSRKPVGQASVELVFDNHDHKLSGEYANFDEVSVKRKVDRNAQSTYSLNGTKCRRKDVTDIFLGTGLGARSYSIIEQGMVSRLIESKPEELRVFIEEAAGISKYKERRKETESRIKRTKDNLERLEDIRDELGRQLQHLQRQSVAAEKYAEFKQQERETTAQLNGLRWRALDEELSENQEAIKSLEIKIESTTADQRGVDAKVEEHLSLNAELTDALGEVQARFYSLGNDIARIEQSIEHNIERIDQLKLDLTETDEVWSQTKEELDVDLKKITQLDAEMLSITPALESARAIEVESSAALEEAEQALRQWQQDWDEFNQQAEEPRQIAEVEQSRIQQLESIVERGIDRRSKLEDERKSLLSGPEDESIAEVSREVMVLEEGLNGVQQKNTQLGLAIEERRAGLGKCSDDLDEARSELQTSKGKLASLEALQQAALGQDNEALNQWLGKKGLDNQLRLAEGLKISEGWELAVEMVLGDSLQSICVEGLDNIQSLLAELPQGKLALIDVAAPQQASHGISSSLSLASLNEKVSSDWGLNDLLQGIYVATSLNEALENRAQLSSLESIITTDGIWLGNNWVQLSNFNKQDSVVERRGVIAELFKKIKKLEELSTNLHEKQDELKQAVRNGETDREALQLEIAQMTKTHSELKSQASAQMAKVEEAELRKQRIHHELEELNRQLTVEEENTSEARARLQDALDSMEKDVGGRENLEAARDERQLALETCRESSRKDKDLAHELALKQQSVQSQLQSTRETMDRMATQVQRSHERMDSLSNQIEVSTEPLAQMRIDLEALLQQRLEVEKDLAGAKSRVDENEHTIRRLEQQRNEIQQSVNLIRENLMQKRLKNEGGSVKRDAILEQLQEAKFELEAVLAALPEDVNEQQCEQDLEKLGNRIQRLGPINLAAIDEYSQQSERKVYLDQQNDDLVRALNTLENAIRKIDKETRSRFKETFDKINSGLQNLFPKVFGGGHAYLDMTGEDLLDTGVAIMARPPGKRNSTIHLLSGGEKAMTAIALVFSIFRLNPSPFCMLDEVDAPLDDANVGRYASLVKEMSESVQFIFITHNKITMEMANQLLGVTMHEAGVSRIVAVDIEEAAELAAM